MNQKTGIVIGVIVLLVIAGGVYVSMTNTKTDQQVVENKDMMEEKKEMENKDTMMKKEETKIIDKVDVALKSGSYEAFSAEKIARVEDGNVVLFFHASWCPSCRALNTSIETNPKSIPEDLTIFKTDYDKETELKKKYGVTTQHTLVQVDTDGNLIKKWSGGATLENLVSQIQ
jgi:thiol-disulfide isomerase/thioredoxin